MFVREENRKTKETQACKPLMIRPILIVEDQKSSAIILHEKIHKDWNVDIHVAQSMAEAKALLKQHRHQYLVGICDLHLPDAQDGEILKLMEKAGVRSIALTGAFKSQTRESLNNKYLIDYVLKDAPNSHNYIVNLIGRLYKNQFIKVLISEDSKSALAMLKDIVTLLNFQVFCAENGKEALKTLEENPDIRLAITDYEMPEMNGFEFTLKARQLLNKDRLAIIGLSASDQTDLGAMFIKNGANDFLLKPYSFEELFCRINMNIDSLEHIDFIHELANKDSLTKLFNRRYFFANGIRMFNEAYLTKQEFTLAMFDIDHFKKINDTYGHDGGDKILIDFANLLKDHFDSHLVARIGGEEFAAILNYRNAKLAESALEKFRQAVADKTIKFNDQNVSISVSIGAVTGVNQGLDDLMKVADNFLYQAKRSGRNCLVFRSPQEKADQEPAIKLVQ